MSVFSQKLKELIKESGMMQKEVAEKIGISPSNLSFYVNGREPNYDILRNIANYFDVTIDYLLGNSPYKHYYDELLALKRREELREQELDSLTNENIERNMKDIKRITNDLSGLLNTLAITEDERLSDFNTITNHMVDLLYLIYNNIIIVDDIYQFQQKIDYANKSGNSVAVNEIIGIYEILREIKSIISELIVNAIYYVMHNNSYSQEDRNSLFQILVDAGSNHIWDTNMPDLFRDNPFDYVVAKKLKKEQNKNKNSLQ